MESTQKFSEQEFIDIVSGSDIDLFYNNEKDEPSFIFGAGNKLAEKYKDSQEKLKIIKLLDGFCSMYYKDEAKEPFGPLLNSGAGRTFLPEDIDEETAKFLFNNLDKIKNVAVKTRIADSLWIIKKLGRSNIESAKIAVEGYYALIDNVLEKNHLHAACIYISRVYHLALSMTGTDERKELWNKFPKYTENNYDKNNDSSAFYWCNLLEKIASLSKSLDSEIVKNIYNKTTAIIDILKSNIKPNFIWVRKFYDIAITLCKSLKLSDSEIASLEIQKAITYETEAGQSQTNFHKLHFLKEAIAEYRKLSGQKEKIAELTKIISETPMDLPYSSVSHSVDITQTANYIKQEITGKDFPTAIFSLVGLFALLFKDSLNKQKMREMTENLNKKSTMWRLFSHINIHSDGRIVNTAQTDEEKLEEFIIRNVLTSDQISMMAILQGIAIINDEHHYLLSDIIEIVEGSPFVPKETQLIVSKGIYNFLLGNMLEASHFLVLQFEECLRHLLYGKSQISRIPNENKNVEYKNTDIEYLLDECVKYKIMDEDIAWFLKIYLTSKTINLRNNIAHGIIEDREYYSYTNTVACYVIMWLVLFHKAKEFFDNDKSNTLITSDTSETK